MDDLPMTLLLLLLIAFGIYVLRQAKEDSKVPAPQAPSGQPYIPLAPACVDPSQYWLLLPSQEE
jgi:hypothetical protein